MKSNTENLEPNAIYHIYNRGINGENIFKEEKNYLYFLQRYAHHITPIADTFAYCLLKNHFHIALKVKNLEEIEAFYKLRFPDKIDLPPIPRIISQQFASFFNGYAQAINKSYNRTGGLFEEPFRRVLVSEDAYLAELIFYIHSNPEKHGFVRDFGEYPHSSYHSHLHTAQTKLKREEVLVFFGGKEKFEEFHTNNQMLRNLDKFMIEFD